MHDQLSFVLADDQVLFVDGLSAILTTRGHRVLAVPRDLPSLGQEVGASKPDVCFVDSQLGGADAIADIPRLIEISPSTRPVVLTADPTSGTLHRALDAGAAGYVHKTRGSSVLLDALRRICLGEIVVEGSFARQASPVSAPDLHMRRLADYLTPRERECLRLLASGFDTMSMAGELGISVTTIRTHVQSVLSKLGVHSRLEAASLAIRYRLVEQAE